MVFLLAACVDQILSRFPLRGLGTQQLMSRDDNSFVVLIGIPNLAAIKILVQCELENALCLSFRRCVDGCQENAQLSAVHLEE